MVERDSENNRRFPRLRARCRVLVRDRYGAWEAETEDLGPRGCRIVTPRPQSVGALVRLTVESDALPARLEVTGQVVWAVRDRPARAGISFAGAEPTPGAPAPAAWFAALAAAEHAAAAPADPEGPPPAEGVELRPEDEDEGDGADELPRRLVDRARELLAGGEAPRAAVLLRRALALAPGDAVAEALLREATGATP